MTSHRGAQQNKGERQHEILPKVRTVSNPGNRLTAERRPLAPSRVGARHQGNPARPKRRQKLGSGQHSGVCGWIDGWMDGESRIGHSIIAQQQAEGAPGGRGGKNKHGDTERGTGQYSPHDFRNARFSGIVSNAIYFAVPSLARPRYQRGYHLFDPAASHIGSPATFREAIKSRMLLPASV